MERHYSSWRSRASQFRSPVLMDTEEIFQLITPFSPSESTSLCAEDWLESIEELKELYGWDNRMTLIYASLRLEDAAKRWFKDNPCDWDEFKVKFIRRFSNRLSKKEYYEELIHRRKEYSESYENYVFDMERTALKCDCSVEDTIHHIISGLRDPELKNQLFEMDCKSVDELLSCLKKLTSVNAEEGDLRIQLGRPKHSVARDSRERICYSCKKPGHVAKDCNSDDMEVRNRPSKESLVKRAVICVSCKQSGHYASDCPTRIIICHICKVKGHKSFECQFRVDKEHRGDRREHRHHHDIKIKEEFIDHQQRKDYNRESKESFCIDCHCNGHTTYECRSRKNGVRREARDYERSPEHLTHSRRDDFLRDERGSSRNSGRISPPRRDEFLREERGFSRNSEHLSPSRRDEFLREKRGCSRNSQHFSPSRRDEFLREERGYSRNSQHLSPSRRDDFHREERGYSRNAEHLTHLREDDFVREERGSSRNAGHFTHSRRDELLREERSYSQNSNRFTHSRRDEFLRDENDHGRNRARKHEVLREENDQGRNRGRKHEVPREERDHRQTPEHLRREKGFRKEIICIKCKKQGHFARDCDFIPENPPVVPICRVCDRKGHDSASCHMLIDEKVREERKRKRNEGQFSQIDEIKKYKPDNFSTKDNLPNRVRNGYVAKHFKVERDTTSRFRDVEKSVQGCNRCGSSNHIPEECYRNKLKHKPIDRPPKESPPETTKRRNDEFKFNKTCYNCRKQGHVAINCPSNVNYKRPNEHSIKTSPKKRFDSTSSEHQTQEHPKILPNEIIVPPIKPNRSLSEYLKPVRIDHVYVTALINLASECTTLQRSEFIKYDWKMQPCNLEVTGFGHSSAMTLGKITKNVCVGEVELMTDILIVEDSIQDFPLVLGSNFLDHPSVCVVKKYRSLDIKLVDENTEKNPVAASTLADIDGEPVQVKTEPDVENELLELLDMIKQDCA